MADDPLPPRGTPPEPGCLLRPHDPAVVKRMAGRWRAAEGVITGRPGHDPPRRGYERAVAAVGATLAGVPTPDALLERYFAPPARGADGGESAQFIEWARARPAAEDPRLVRQVVEDAAYARHAAQLLAAWWTADWPPSAHHPQERLAPRRRTGERKGRGGVAPPDDTESR